jgi:Tfp pilus assembly protein PilE
MRSSYAIFTELLIVMLFLMVLSIIIIPTMNKQLSLAREAKANAELLSIENIIQLRLIEGTEVTEIENFLDQNQYDSFEIDEEGSFCLQLTMDNTTYYIDESGVPGKGSCNGSSVLEGEPLPNIIQEMEELGFELIQIEKLLEDYQDEYQIDIILFEGDEEKFYLEFTLNGKKYRINQEGVIQDS